LRLVVFGAGAIGSLLGAYLDRSGQEVTLVGRPDHVQAIRARGLRVEGDLDGTFRPDAREELPAGIETDRVLLTVKAFDLSSASKLIAHRLKAAAPILALPNGLGTEEEILRGLREGGWTEPDRFLVRGINTIPATLVGPGVIRQAGHGEILLPEASGKPNADLIELFERTLTRASLPVRHVKDFELEVWRKVLLNAAINPVTADHRIPNGRLLEDPWRGQALQLLREAQTVARLAGHSFPDDEVELDLWKVVRATASNRSSMLQDRERGRRTEIDAISGALVRIARAHGIDLPATERAVRRLEAAPRSHASQVS